MNLNMLIHYDDFHLSTFSIIQDGKFQPQIKGGKDLGSFMTREALKFAGRKVGSRLVPIIGWVMLAKDIYEAVAPED